tara:strand:+ start:1588 stop:2214 length:627 start_codon:yes stop_codon:yes gene_type:complete
LVGLRVRGVRLHEGELGEIASGRDLDRRGALDRLVGLGRELGCSGALIGLEEGDPHEACAEEGRRGHRPGQARLASRPAEAGRDPPRSPLRARLGVGGSDFVADEGLEEVGSALAAGAEVRDELVRGLAEVLAGEGHVLDLRAGGGVYEAREPLGQSAIRSADAGQPLGALRALGRVSFGSRQLRHALDGGGVEEGVDLGCLETTHTP